MKKSHISFIFFLIFCPLISFSQTTYHCSFNASSLSIYDDRPGGSAKFDYTIGVSEIVEIKHNSQSYWYTFEINYFNDNSYFDAGITVYDSEHDLREENYLYYTAYSTYGTPNYFNLDLKIPRVMVDFDCRKK